MLLAVVLKTGATEAMAKLPTILHTSLRCVRNPLLLSDLNQQFEGHMIHDVLANFTPSAMENNTDFDLYRKQQELAREHPDSDFTLLHQKTANKMKNPAWALDKYKFLRTMLYPMACVTHVC